MFSMDVKSALLSLFLASVSIILLLVGRFILSTLRPTKFPPGPPVFPGLGNLHQIPLEKPYFTFSSLAKRYGPILGLKFGPANVVVLHRAEHVHELLETRGACYAGRPKMAIPCDYVFPGEWEQHAVFMSIDFQRRQRKSIRHHLGPIGLEEIAPVQRAVAARLMYDLLMEREFTEVFHHWALASPLPMIGGQRVEDLGKGWVEKYHAVQKKWIQLLEPGATPPVDIFPILGWLPQVFAGWKRTAAFVQKGIHETYAALLVSAKQRHHERYSSENGPNMGRYEPLMARMLRENDEKPQELRFSDRDIALVGGGILDAAADTTLNAALFLVQALAAHTAIQSRAQREVDNLWGREAIPGQLDIAKLPYVTACIMEVLRWRPAAPQALPRLCMADEDVLGYHIPKNSIILVNVWGIQHDPDLYDRPDEFDPERFMKSPLGIKPQQDNPGVRSWRKPLYTFGAGRRLCPGEQFALNSLQVTFAQLLWAYDIVPAGPLDLSPQTGMISALSPSPSPFQVKFVPRNEKARQAVLSEYYKTDQILTDLLP